jgi:hypothetical protein
MFARCLVGLLAASLFCAVSTAAPDDTPLIRSVYEAPIPADPMALWDRVLDLHWLNRPADAKLLQSYLERMAVAQILGEPPHSAPTLDELLRVERTAPALDPALITRVLARFSGSLDDSADIASVPKDYRGQVQYRYEGHAVWSQLRNPKEAYLHIRLSNDSDHDVGSLSASVRIVSGTQTIDISCQAGIGSVLHSGASTGALCPTAQVRSTARPGFYTVIDTATLVELIESVGRGAATLSVAVADAYFPEYSVGVDAAGAQPFNVNMRARTFPPLTNISCEDRGTCAAERAAKRDHVLFSGPSLLLATLLAGCAIGYLLLRVILGVGGGARALPFARNIVEVIALVCFGTAAWNWHALETNDGEGWGGVGYFVVMIGAGLFGIGMLIAMLLVRPTAVGVDNEG